MNSYIPDVNVWLALTLRRHVHFGAARAWYTTLPQDSRLVFCRVSQLGFLRLLTTKAVAYAETMTQREAWAVYDRWLREGGATFEDEPYGLEFELRSLASLNEAAAKNWTDSYLAAFAISRSLELVTFDKGLSKRCGGSVLLG